MREHTIPFVTLPNWVKAASRCGFNIEPILRRHGIETGMLALEQVRVSESAMDGIMAECVARSREQYFPFVLGETFAFEYLSDLETFVTTSRTLREAARVFLWLRRFINPLLHVRLVESGDSAALVLTGPPVHQHHTEALFASTLKFARLLFGSKPAFHHISFTGPPAAKDVDYQAFFGMPVLFEQPRNEISFARSLLDQPLKGDFPALHRQAEQRIRQQLAEREDQASLADAVRDLLTGEPGLFGRGIEPVAGLLGLHPRTLQRRLREEQCSFAELHDQLRYRAAVDALLRGKEDLETLSERLGYSDRRSFTRAFKRWSGQSPHAFRKHGGVRGNAGSLSTNC